MDKKIYVILIASFLINLIIMPILIPVLRRLKFGQTIREIGPKWHEKKNGTPTMGGLGFLATSVVVSLIFCKNDFVKLCIVFAALYGVIGFLDDFIKIVLKRNLGLNEKQKMLLQILVTVAFLVISIAGKYIDTTVWIPFTKIYFNLSWFYILFAAFFMVGFTNAVNLTDGVDGLAASVTTVVCVFYAAAAIMLENSELSYFAVAIAGSLVAFLVFNFNPAKVFMGDTGSLFLGGAVSIFAVATKTEILFILVGIIYLIEALSVILQVAHYKRTHKRLFLMSPIHHHFEMKGYKEKKIVYMFSGVTIAACAVALIALI